MVGAQVPEAAAAWGDGGYHVELGCGAGGTLLGMLVDYPQLRVVGVDIDAAVLDEARRRAEGLGVGNRLELRLTDARAMPEEGVFDTVFWSQPCFPAAARPAVLAAAKRLLRPGGYLFTPILAEPPMSAEALRTPAGHSYALGRLVNTAWGVPNADAGELRAEVEQAGFTFFRAAAREGNPVRTFIFQPSEGGPEKL